MRRKFLLGAFSSLSLFTHSNHGFANPDVFNPGICGGVAMTAGSMYRRFAPGATQADIAKVALYARSRECNKATGCGVWHNLSSSSILWTSYYSGRTTTVGTLSLPATGKLSVRIGRSREYSVGFAGVSGFFMSESESLDAPLKTVLLDGIEKKYYGDLNNSGDGLRSLDNKYHGKFRISFGEGCIYGLTNHEHYDDYTGLTTQYEYVLYGPTLPPVRQVRLEEN